jgi:exopolysaccharide biosynthesis predicted pyruvyltransferase EpsI
MKLSSVRDSYSFQIISKHCKNVRYIPDALFTLKNNRGFKYDDLIKPVDVNLNEMPDNCIAISGGSWPLSKAQPVEVKKESYTRLINRILESGKKVALISTCDGDRWLEDLAKDLGVYHVPADISSKKFIDVFKKVKIFISGRFHPSIMASTLGIPCIFFESNSHKTMSLQKDLKYKDIKVYKMPLSDSDVNSILNRIDEYIETLEEHSSKILKTVDVLSKSVTTNGLFKKIKKKCVTLKLLEKLESTTRTEKTLVNS